MKEFENARLKVIFFSDAEILTASASIEYDDETGMIGDFDVVKPSGNL